MKPVDLITLFGTRGRSRPQLVDQMASPRHSRAQAFQAVEGVQVCSMSIRLRFLELCGAGAPSGEGRSSPQPVDQIASLATRGRRRGRSSTQLVEQIARLGTPGRKPSQRWRVLKFAACQLDRASRNSKSQADQAAEGAQFRTLWTKKLRFCRFAWR